MVLSRLKLRMNLIKKGNLEDIFNNRYSLYSAIINLIHNAEPKLAYEIHENKLPRAFTFSNMIFSKGISNSRYTHIYVVSPKEEIYKSILRGSKMNPIIKIGSYKWELSEIEYELITETNEYSPLSPIILRDKEGKNIQVKSEEHFAEIVSEGLMRIAKRISVNYKIDLPDSKPIIKLKGNFKEQFREKLYKIKDSYWKAYEPKKRVIIEINKPWNKIAYYFGIGDKTKMGFGMLGI